MAQYRVLSRSFIGNRIVEEGEEVPYDGIPGSNLEPLDAEAKKAVAAAGRRRHPASAAGDDKALAAANERADTAEAAAKEAEERVTALEAELAAANEQIAKFDGDGNGKTGGSKPKEPEKKDDKALA